MSNILDTYKRLQKARKIRRNQEYKSKLLSAKQEQFVLKCIDEVDCKEFNEEK